MRRLLVLLGLLAWSIPALAGEFELPTLRGSDAFVPVVPENAARWRGLYVGGQVGYHNLSADGAGITQPLIADMLRVLLLESEQHVSQWTVLGKGETRSIGFGGYIGYNVGWEGVILGIEGGWTKVGGTADLTSNPLTRATSTSNNLGYLVTVNGTGSVAINGYGTAKVRAGWDAGNFLPYASLGVAVGQASYTKSATVSGTQTDSQGNVVPFAFHESQNKVGAWVYGLVLGAGVDVLVVPNVFLRFEYEYVAFLEFANFKVAINTARAGIGFKF